jgi:hypothetical protein
MNDEYSNSSRMIRKSSGQLTNKGIDLFMQISEFLSYFFALVLCFTNL